MTSSWRWWRKRKKRWRRGKRTKRWMTRMAKKRRKRRQDPGHSCPCYWHHPTCSWLHWLWGGAECHRWPLGISAAQCKAFSPAGSVGWSPLLFCHSRGFPSVQDGKTENDLVCLNKVLLTVGSTVQLFQLSEMLTSLFCIKNTSQREAKRATQTAFAQ